LTKKKGRTTTTKEMGRGRISNDLILVRLQSHKGKRKTTYRLGGTWAGVRGGLPYGVGEKAQKV